MKGFISAVAGFLFTLFASLAVIAFSFDQTLFSPAFLKKSLVRSGIYVKVAEFITHQVNTQLNAGEIKGDSRIDETIIVTIAEDTIDDVFTWLGGKGGAPFPPSMGAIFDQSIPLTTGEYAGKVPVYYQLYQFILPFSILLSVVCLLTRILVASGTSNKLRSVVSPLLATGIPGLLVFIAPLMLQTGSSIGGLQSFPPELIAFKEPLFHWLAILLSEIAIIQGIFFGLMIGTAIFFYLLARLSAQSRVTSVSLSQNTPGSKN